MIVAEMAQGLNERTGLPVVIVILAGFAVFGVHMIVRPRKHLKGHLRGGGDLRREWNEMSIQIAGLIVTTASGYALFQLAQSFWQKGMN